MKRKPRQLSAARIQGPEHQLQDRLLAEGIRHDLFFSRRRSSPAPTTPYSTSRYSRPAPAFAFGTAAAFDVFEEEPTDYNNPLLRLENFVGTPHVAAHTQEAMQRMSMVAEDIVRVIRGKAPQYPANQPKTARQTVVPTELRHS